MIPCNAVLLQWLLPEREPAFGGAGYIAGFRRCFVAIDGRISVRTVGSRTPVVYRQRAAINRRCLGKARREGVTSTSRTCIAKKSATSLGEKIYSRTLMRLCFCCVQNLYISIRWYFPDTAAVQACLFFLFFLAYFVDGLVVSSLTVAVTVKVTVGARCRPGFFFFFLQRYPLSRRSLWWVHPLKSIISLFLSMITIRTREGREGGCCMHQ